MSYTRPRNNMTTNPQDPDILRQATPTALRLSAVGGSSCGPAVSECKTRTDHVTRARQHTSIRQDIEGISPSRVQNVKHSHPCSCPFKCVNKPKFASVGSRTRNDAISDLATSLSTHVLCDGAGFLTAVIDELSRLSWEGAGKDPILDILVRYGFMV